MFARQIAALAPLLVGAFAVQSVHLVNCGTRDSVVVVSRLPRPTAFSNTLAYFKFSVLLGRQ